MHEEFAVACAVPAQNEMNSSPPLRTADTTAVFLAHQRAVSPTAVFARLKKSNATQACRGLKVRSRETISGRTLAINAQHQSNMCVYLGTPKNGQKSFLVLRNQGKAENKKAH
jgi:hypothetical protein